jgi:cytochrome c biogenesis protein CcmG, thiol:disulfide interchange protein DsbE
MRARAHVRTGRGPVRRLQVGAALAGLLALASCRGDGPPPAPIVSIEVLSTGIFAEFDESADPSLARDPESGHLHLAWVARSGEEWNLYHARSADAGASFDERHRVNDRFGEVHPHAEGAPRLVVAPGVVAAFWNNRIEVEGRAFGASDLLFSRSTDGGAAWEPSRALQDDTVGVLPRGNSFHGAVWTGDSTLVVAWLDGRERDARRVERAVEAGLPPEEARRDPEAHAHSHDPHDGDATVYAAYSHDLGATWEPANRRLQEGICPCCRVSLVRGPGEEVYGAWRGNFPGSIRDPAFHRLHDPEAPHIRIHHDHWEYPGCPHSGPGLAVDPAGAVHATWYTGAEGRMGVHYARMEPGAESFGAPLQLVGGTAIPVAHPAIAMLPDGGAVVAHNVDGEGERVIVLTGISPAGEIAFQKAVADSDGGTHPQVVHLDEGRLVVAWTESRGGLQRVRLARVMVDKPRSPTPEGPGSRSDATGPGTPAPEYSGRTLDGETISLADLQGQVVVLNVWATWCGPCVREMPALERLHRAYEGRGVRVVGASIDRGGAASAIRRFLDTHDITFTILHDPDQIVTRQFRTLGVPETFLIGRDGKIAHRWFGEFDPMAPEAVEQVERVLEDAGG